MHAFWRLGVGKLPFEIEIALDLDVAAPSLSEPTFGTSRSRQSI
jgi:hypothetical protein